MEYLRNLPERPAALAGLVTLQPERVVSRALSKSERCRMTLLAFAAGESVSEEQYFGDTLYYVLEGEMPLQRAGETCLLRTGECAAVPAGVSHAVGGAGPFKVLQITVE